MIAPKAQFHSKKKSFKSVGAHRWGQTGPGKEHDLRQVRISTLGSAKDAPATRNWSSHTVGIKMFYNGVVQKFGIRESPSSSHHGPKPRGPFQQSFKVASKREVNIRR
ncbi:hypothetical protein AVEN_218163-1 [Araneus ventricosus]|uniref:Uncharacterized protein n=1 Tax=Araneus ventricosus TaxID=182803 RepID=A0A4Y2FUF5_ARAVE|nr:hypothetical protein AVEN_218163-1 [Araneus ventricosus]